MNYAHIPSVHIEEPTYIDGPVQHPRYVMPSETLRIDFGRPAVLNQIKKTEMMNYARIPSVHIEESAYIDGPVQHEEYVMPSEMTHQKSMRSEKKYEMRLLRWSSLTKIRELLLILPAEEWILQNMT